IWLSTFFGFFVDLNDNLGGAIGFEINAYLQDYIGVIGTSLILLFCFITYLAIRFRLTFESFAKHFSKAKKDIKEEFSNKSDDDFTMVFDNNLSVEAEDIKSAYDLPVDLEDIPKETPANKEPAS